MKTVTKAELVGVEGGDQGCRCPIHITVGDLLITSSTPGHAPKYRGDGRGIIIGKALQSLDAGTGSILMLVTNF